MQYLILCSKKMVYILVLLVLVQGIGVSGCIPAFRGFQAVTRDDLNPKAKPSADAEILMQTNYYRDRWNQVGSPFGTFWRHHSRIRYNKRPSFDSAKWVLAGNLLDMELRTVCPDGRVLRMTASDIQQFTRINNTPTYKFSAPGLDEGCIVDVMWEIDTAAAFALKVPLRQKYPIRKAHFRYDYDSSYVLRPHLSDTEYLWLQLAAQKARKRAKPGAASQPKKGSETKQALSDAEKNAHIRLDHDRRDRRVELWLHDIPADPNPQFPRIVQSVLLPPRYTLPPTLNIHLVQTLGIGGRNLLLAWRNVDESFTSPSFVFSETRTPQERNYQTDEEEELRTEALPTLAKQITAQASTQQSKAIALYHHLRQHMTVTKPAATSSINRLDKVYALGIGDTYEINMLYVVMLRSLGIRAYLALTAPGNHSRYLDEEPRKVFGSVATYLPDASEGAWRGLHEESSRAKEFLANKGSDYAGGRIVTTGWVLDPSHKGMPFGMLSSSLSNTWIYVIDRSGGRFFQTPEIDAQKNIRHIQVKANVAADGSLQGSVSFSRWGQFAAELRQNLEKTAKHTWTEKMLGAEVRRLCGPHVQVTLEEQPNLELATLSEPLRYSYRFQTTSCIPHALKHLMFPLLPARSLGLASPTQPTRLAPVSFGTPSIVKVDLALTFPTGYQVMMSLPPTWTGQAPGVSATIAVSSASNNMTYKTEMRFSQRELPVASYPSIRSLYTKLHDLNKTPVLVGQGR